MYNYAKERAKLIRNQIDDYGYTFCEQCTKSNAFKFHTHHIIFRSEAPKHENLHHPLNLLIVCNFCHDDFHNNKALRNSLVVIRGLNELLNGKYDKD